MYPFVILVLPTPYIYDALLLPVRISCADLQARLNTVITGGIDLFQLCKSE